MTEADIKKLAEENDNAELKKMLSEMDIDTEAMSEEQLDAVNAAIDRILDGLSDDEIEALMDELGIEDPFDGIISLTDENGNEVDFEFLDEVEYEGDIYLVLAPLDADDTDEEEAPTVLVLKVEGDGTDEEEYVPVDDTIAGAVFDLFLQAQEEE